MEQRQSLIKNMKDSGIEWIGGIPYNWSLERLQWYLDEIKELNNPIKTEQVLSLTNKLGVVPYEEKGEQGNKAKENLNEYKVAYPNTIVANSMNILIGSVGICNYTGCVSPVYYVFKSNKKCNIRFINFILQTKEYQKELRKYANGILEIRLRVSSNGILKRKIAIPDLDTQNKIVDYIDNKVEKINDLIKNEEDQIQKLKEYKQSLITEVVTKGLDKNVEMKDSGVEWIGKIPKDWQLIPIKAKFKSGKGLPITKADLVEDGIRVISYGQIHAKENTSVEINNSLYRYVDNKWLQSNIDCIVKKGDFIFADTSEDVAGSGDFIYINNNDLTFAGYHCLTLKPIDDNCNNKYLAYLFLSTMWKSQLQSKVCGVKLYSISKKFLMSTSIILPPINEQKEIVKVLDGKCKTIEEVITIKKEKIEKLNEYKKALIYEYVTGKKEV